MEKDKNYFAEAGEFIKDDDVNFQNLNDKFEKYVIDNKFDQNEVQLFRYHVMNQIDLQLTMGGLKGRMKLEGINDGEK